MPEGAPAEARPLAWGFTALAILAFSLIVLGALVRANGAGLACPDWPLCFGELVPSFDFRIALEWGHRLLAGGLSLGLAGLSVFVWLRPRAGAVVRRTLLLAWLLLLVQVGLGGLTVLLKIAPWTVTAHLLVGHALCLTLLWASRSLFSQGSQGPHDGGGGERAEAPGAVVYGLASLCVVLLAAQLVIGGMVASHAAGLACASFPTCDGRELVPTWSGLVGLHVLHRTVGLTIPLGYFALFWTVRRDIRLAPLARLGSHLVVLQVILGILNVLLRLPVEITALHSAAAAGIVLVTGLLVREILAASAPEPQTDRAVQGPVGVP